jgi:hypothetical protein
MLTDGSNNYPLLQNVQRVFVDCLLLHFCEIELG